MLFEYKSYHVELEALSICYQTYHYVIHGFHFKYHTHLLCPMTFLPTPRKRYIKCIFIEASEFVCF